MPVRKPAAAPPPSAPVAVRLRLRIRIGDVVAIGPGKVDLLEAVAAHGSIAAAARSMGMSYRRAWLLLDELNRSLARPAIETAQGGPRGGGARVSPTGEAVIREYRAAERVALVAARPHLSRLLRRLRKAPDGEGPL